MRCIRVFRLRDYETDINNLNDRLDALETGRIADVEDQLASLQEALASAESAIDAIEALNLEELSQDLSDLKGTVQEIENGLSDYATLDYVEATFATKTDVADLNTKLGELEGDLKSLEGKYDSDLKISEIIKKIDQAQADASGALGRLTHSLTHSEYTPRPVNFRLLLTASWISLTLTPSSRRLFRLLSTRTV